MIIREAIPGDEDAIMHLINELAIYEKAPEEVFATSTEIGASLFQENPVAFCHVAEVDGKVVGIALWFLNYSTWLGKPGLYLEDLFVLQEHRGKGYGMALLKKLAAIAIERDYERFQWWVLDWNQPSIDLYKQIGAEPMDEWTVFRLSGDALRKFAL
ncbi:unannotated protein [freshwater metagenome]|jgi:GNAT superfamily N-acetyltransferase|uniref:Unannotated protein n=1 Tax=freshwater metagenome TaxID=449393 RepID=A0A6J6VE11_9ZZZZ|nr:GNAT family N-acetyltransferase [Actinomycetota bacterium]TRZ86813.1 MAG: GNAT family N-acetyltransferase [Streptomycetaceae bacterium]MSX48258.1 GNAT family N-acetyltransferase [Actinomycetota bacterium]MSX62076.1 GNAT family N-acetyltransferase [Actinomycetota bacterium]MSY09629.1 GNAT family N-acetyltransferase [Actinomycetota bacterium]